MYECASLLHWVHVSERVRMRASFWDSILVYFGWEWVAHSIIVRETSDFSLISLDPCSIHHSIYIGCDYFLCFDAGWPSINFLPPCFLVSLLCSSIPLHLIWSHSFLILLNVWLEFSIYTLFLLIRYVHPFIITFHVGTPRSRTHDVFYALHNRHGRYGDYIIGIFEPSFLSFLSPYYLSLRYVLCLKTTLRPLLHTLCLTAHTWAILELGRRLFLRAWWMGSWDDDLHWAYPYYQWWIFRGDIIYIGAYPAHRWQFLSGMTLCTEA